MLSSPIDAQAAMQSAYADDPVRKKLAVDSLKQRLGDSRTEDQKLQEACEGFESIFIQKMWEQMRKNVPKEGYLHSKDEETYQSMFDTELAKKMTEAGGIGLAEMLREQLSQKLSDASRGSASGGSREPIPLATTREALETARARELAANDLYSAVPDGTDEPAVAVPQPVAADPEAVVRQALAEMRDEYETGMSPESMAAAMNGPLMGRLPHYVAPGAEPRVVAGGPDAAAHFASRPGRVSAPGKGAPSGRRTAQRHFEAAAEIVTPTAGPQTHPAAVAVQARLAAQAEGGAENTAEASRNAASVTLLSAGEDMPGVSRPDVSMAGGSGETGGFVPPDGAAAVRSGNSGHNAAHVRGPQPLNAWGGVEEALKNAASPGVDLRT